ncbi:PH domain-containing protein [Haloferacaceae archaeon DSL9]
MEQTGTDTDLPLEWLSLDEAEEVLWASTPHRYSLLPAAVIGIPLSLVLVGIPILVGAYLTHTNTNYVVTTSGLYRKTGVFSRDVQQIGFDKVQNTSYTQTAFGSYFGYGTVDISTAGGVGIEMRFRSVPNPASVQELITRRTELRGDETDDREKGDVLEEILAELRGIRRAVEGDDAPSETRFDAPNPRSETAFDTPAERAERDADDPADLFGSPSARPREDEP